jgi:hypothetical protein
LIIPDAVLGGPWGGDNNGYLIMYIWLIESYSFYGSHTPQVLRVPCTCALIAEPVPIFTLFILYIFMKLQRTSPK